MGEVCLVGYGRVGRVTALSLRKARVDVIVYDSSGGRVSLAKRDGFEAHLADSTNKHIVSQIASTCDVIATALPSAIAEKVLKLLLEEGARVIVDVSYIPDPLAFEDEAVERGAKLFVDAGLAPGLSNMLAARAVRGFDRIDRLVIYVGGIAESPSEPLGLVASWSIYDLLEEYSRPSRARIGGKQVNLDPIDDATVVDIPGLGSFDAMPTDGLRTLLRSIGRARTMIEYTLRYRGHVTMVKTLRQLGLLDTKPHVIGGCSVPPRDVLAKVLEEKLPKHGDRVILHVVSEGYISDKRVTRSYTIDVTQKKLGIDVPALTFLTGLTHSWFVRQALEGKGHLGVNAPEELAGEIGSLISELKGLGVHVERRECVEEFD
jgi:lysine 6-dehydrogenase